MIWVVFCRTCKKELKRSFSVTQMRWFAEYHSNYEEHDVILGFTSGESISIIVEYDFINAIVLRDPKNSFQEDDWEEENSWHNIVRLYEEG